MHFVIKWIFFLLWMHFIILMELSFPHSCATKLESWLVRVGDSFIQGHQDPGGSLPLAQDFLHLHLQLLKDTKVRRSYFLLRDFISQKK